MERKKWFLGGSTRKCLFFCLRLTQKNAQSNVQKEENLEDVQIDEQETDEPEMNTYEIPEGQSNITSEETSSSSHGNSHTQSYFPTKGK